MNLWFSFRWPFLIRPPSSGLRDSVAVHPGTSPILCSYCLGYPVTHHDKQPYPFNEHSNLKSFFSILEVPYLFPNGEKNQVAYYAIFRVVIFKNATFVKRSAYSHYSVHGPRYMRVHRTRRERCTCISWVITAGIRWCTVHGVVSRVRYITLVIL